MSERTTGSSQSPSYWHRSDQSRHHVSVSSMAPSGDSPAAPAVGVIPGEREGDALARRHGEVAERPEVLAPERDRRPQPEGVVPADRADPVRLPAHPRNPRPVVQPENQLDAHGDGAALPLDHPDEGVRLRSACSRSAPRHPRRSRTRSRGPACPAGSAGALREPGPPARPATGRARPSRGGRRSRPPSRSAECRASRRSRPGRRGPPSGSSR